MACSDGDPSAPSTSAAQHAAEEMRHDAFASTAASLPAPDATQAPALTTAPEAPTDAPPPRIPTSGQLTTTDAARPQERLVPPTLLRQTVVSQLQAPTDLALTREGVLFYTERTSGLFVLRPGGDPLALFRPGDLIGTGTSGLLGVALDPQFSSSPEHRHVFVLMRATTQSSASGRVVQLTLNKALNQVVQQHDILVVNNDAHASAVSQSITGALRFGPDGHLYIGLGNEVLRVDRHELTSLSSNAKSRLVTSNLNQAVALGFHAFTDALIVAYRPHIKASSINLVVGARAQCSDAKPIALDAGITAIERLTHPMWGEWRNAFLLAFDETQKLDVMKLDARGCVVQVAPVLRNLGFGFKALAHGPDGVYVATQGKAGGEEIWRLKAQ